MTLPVRNFFNIADPDYCAYRVWSYIHGHSMMLVRVIRSEPDDFFFLAFDSVQYFQGPLHWMGARFQVGTTDECAELLQEARVGLSDDLLEMPDGFLNTLLQKFRLYTVELPNLEVKILAGDAIKASEVPPTFSRLIK